MYEVQHISISIARRPEDVYTFASNPANLPQWAAGLASSQLTQGPDGWVAEAPFGRVKIRFADRNNFGVMDHDVELASGVLVHNPMRVVPNGEGSEFLFTLIRQPDMTDEQFAEDRLAIETDLRTLKTLLEK
ncbi:polyketide cyclase [Marinobacter nanhaiticus D15-8W]|uniref:SRPBCC family protein n=1 Tax=Marinobacter nanhaiticus D15-8W TaxID=626887 RepID=N6WNT8_9GAMM|nr:SRPBCC family protein [Marinobacter nanhaiticus]ENO13186.1 SRPBCC family protein [Marinobacter nanhaiticus D15-8W]BES70546.1 polyketide cyclase [Marinobacter nanhaiticus D15-8W]